MITTWFAHIHWCCVHDYFFGIYFLFRWSRRCELIDMVSQKVAFLAVQTRVHLHRQTFIHRINAFFVVRHSMLCYWLLFIRKKNEDFMLLFFFSFEIEMVMIIARAFFRFKIYHNFGFAISFTLKMIEVKSRKILTIKLYGIYSNFIPFFIYI